MHAAQSTLHQAPAPPMGAAIAGILFAILFIVSLVIIRLAVPADPSEPGAWLSTPASRQAVSVALHLVPFAGIAFLWFIGVLRNRLGPFEDQFFSTVVLGSGLLFLATFFGAAGLAGGLLASVPAGAAPLPSDPAYRFGRMATYILMNVFAIKMAGVFMISTSTLGIRTGVIPRWIALVGYVFALVLLLSITSFEWIAALFPVWVLILSTYILVADVRQRAAPAASDPAAGPA